MEYDTEAMLKALDRLDEALAKLVELANLLKGEEVGTEKVDKEDRTEKTDNQMMQWCSQGCVERCVHSWPGHAAADIVKWINDNGGEAHYESAATPAYDKSFGPYGPRIVIRSRYGRVHAYIGDTIVMGDCTFALWGNTTNAEGRLLREFTLKENR